jgi:DNA-binding XRE family transcriptional regulator
MVRKGRRKNQKAMEHTKNPNNARLMMVLPNNIRRSMKVPVEKVDVVWRAIRNAIAHSVQEPDILWRVESRGLDAVTAGAHAASIIRTSRGQLGMSQKSLAKALGVSQAYVSDLERGKRPIKVGMAQRLARALAMDQIGEDVFTEN